MNPNASPEAAALACIVIKNSIINQSEVSDCNSHISWKLSKTSGKSNKMLTEIKSAMVSSRGFNLNTRL